MAAVGLALPSRLLLADEDTTLTQMGFVLVVSRACTVETLRHLGFPTNHEDCGGGRGSPLAARPRPRTPWIEPRLCAAACSRSGEGIGVGGSDGRIHAVEAVTAGYGVRCEEVLGEIGRAHV